VTVTFKLKPGKKTKQLYAKVKKQKLTALLVKITFKGADGSTLVKTSSFKMK
jgi:hypothetical protein